MTIVAPRGAGFSPVPALYSGPELYLPDTPAESSFDELPDTSLFLPAIAVEARLDVRRNLFNDQSDSAIGYLRQQLAGARSAVDSQAGPNHRHELARLDVLSAAAESQLGGNRLKALGHVARAASQLGEAAYEPMAAESRPAASWPVISLAGRSVLNSLLPGRGGKARQQAIAATNFR